MIEQTLSAMEQRVREAPALRDDTRADLLRLVEHLRAEVEHLAESEPEPAAAIAGLADRSAEEATRDGATREDLDTSLEGLTESVHKFEASHPSLVEIVNRICVQLSDLGI